MSTPRVGIALLAVVLMVATAVAIATTGGVVAEPTAPASVHEDPPDLGLDSCADDPPDEHADPESDAMGWYDGLWYDEPIDVDQSDGLTEDELDTVIARTMARWEALRCLQFEHDVPIEVIDRGTYQDEYQETEVSDDVRLFENARAQALFVVDGETDAIAEDRANRGESVMGFYDIGADEIVLVAEGEEVVVDEPVLGHELGHALQAQHFGLDGFGSETTDGELAHLGLIEGEVSFVQRVYESHCDGGAWDGECLTPPGEPTEPGIANWGLFLQTYHPYADGPGFAYDVYQSGGWDAVGDLHDATPASAKEVMYPDLHGTFETENPSVPDRSTDDWERIEYAQNRTHDRVGEPALFSAFMYPGLDDGTSGQLIDPQELFNFVGVNELDPMDPYNYEHRYTDGWVGDRFVPYVPAGADRSDSPEVAYTYAINFEDGAEAGTFLEGYEALLDLWGAEAVPLAEEASDGTAYRIDEGDRFAGAYWVERADRQVTLVHAPSVDDLSSVDDSLDVTEATSTPTPTPDATPTPTSAPSPAPSPTPTPGTEGIPGFSVALAVVALIAMAAGAARVRRR